MPDEIWGLFSVEDFARRRAFVAEVLLYDRLVVPYPTLDEQELWASRGLNLGLLDGQMELLRTAGLLREAPWSEAKTDLFRQRLETADALTEDVALREHLLSAGYEDWVDWGVTRMVLADDFKKIPERLGYLQIPAGTYVEPIPAYSSYGGFAAHVPLAPVSDGESTTSARTPELAGVFSWELFVPEASYMTDGELLKSAIRIATTDELREKRHDFHAWRRQQVSRGVLDEDALADCAIRLAAYREATNRFTIKTRIINACTVIGIAGSLASAALAFPPAGIGAAIFTAARFAADQKLPDRSPDSQARPVAMFHDAPRHFGWADS